MSYVALARRYRPRQFSQLLGQEHVSKALTNALKQDRLHHAYLFTGTRGVGKTSVARLLAKALNCETGVHEEPCLTCDACLAIEQGHFVDLIEIDGASKTRVEDTRELLENIQYAPTRARFKIYLIDEVHMLSQHSFNALLKTLEEPPSHVKFLLATTDPQKLPLTILSRCLQFNLKHVTEDIICQQLQHILEKEKRQYDEAALQLLAKAARGSMRDALSLLDQAIACSDEQVSLETVKRCLGYTQQDYALQLLQALVAQSPQQLLDISRQIAIEGGHFHYVIEEIQHYLHQMSICQHLPSRHPLLSPEPQLHALSTQLTPEDVQLFYQIACKSTEELHLAPTMSIGFEMMLLRMYTFKPATPVAIPPLAHVCSQPLDAQPVIQEKSQSLSLANKESYQHDNIAVPPPANPISPPKLPAPIMKTVAESTPPIYAPSPADKTAIPLTPSSNETTDTQDWAAIVPHLKLSGLALNAAENAELISQSSSHVTLRVATGHRSLFTTAVINRIEQGLANYYNNVVKLELVNHEQVSSSPAQQREHARQRTQTEAEVALQSDPFFQQLRETFCAELVRNSIEPVKDD